jgi:hypothetical protein
VKHQRPILFSQLMNQLHCRRSCNHLFGQGRPPFAQNAPASAAFTAPRVWPSPQPIASAAQRPRQIHAATSSSTLHFQA